MVINIYRTTEGYTDVTLSQSGFEAKSAADAERLAAEIARLLREHCSMANVAVMTKFEDEL